MDNSEVKEENNNYLEEGDNYFYLADFKNLSNITIKRLIRHIGVLTGTMAFG